MKKILRQLFLLLLLCTGVPALADGSGTGFFISQNGYIATNFHVIRNATAVRVRDSTGAVSSARVVLGDPANDLAVLQIDGGGYFPLPIRASSQVKKGTSVFAIGFPNPTLQGRESKVTEGIISSLSGFRGAPNSYQISVPIQPGNSGGPLVDPTGSVVGITSAGMTASAMLATAGVLPQNINYAVKSNYLMELLSTDENIRSMVTVANSDKTLPLTTLVARAERSIVFIVVKTAEEEETGAPASAPPSDVPRFVADAKAAEYFRLGSEAYRQQDYTKALLYFGSAGTLGHAEAQRYTGDIYYKGQGTPQNYAEAYGWYRKAAEQGNVIGQAWTGLMLQIGRGTAKNEAGAARWYLLAAEQGNDFSQEKLGFLYYNGYGVAKDPVKSAQWLRKAADQGMTASQAWLGHMYLHGIGLTKDYAQALNWLQKSPGQREMVGQFDLGLLYANGWGVAQDDAEALKWLRRSADQGLAEAQNYVGVMYANGRGVGRDDAEAVAWFTRAADQGLAVAQRNLGFRYASGVGVAKNIAEATKWYEKASKQGDTVAQAKLKELVEGAKQVSQAVSVAAAAPAPQPSAIGVISQVNTAYGFAIVSVSGPVPIGAGLLVDARGRRLSGIAEKQSGGELSITLEGQTIGSDLVGARVYVK
ncbi:MAG: bifunctional trypsin-like peptidase domain-containing/SEL1-like repeat protein [Pseudomonadota bacterium]